MVSLVTVLATQADGRTLIHDWMYESASSRSNSSAACAPTPLPRDPHRIVVSGPTKPEAAALDSRDLRSGMALIAAALAADGRASSPR